MVERRTIAAAHWVCAFVVFASFFLRLSVLWDGDSYYHLAVARLYASHGPAAPIPWARFSLVGRGADKDLLFHLILIPFAALRDAAIGGRIALALLNATVATIIALLASRSIGNAAFLLPLWLWIAAPPFFARVVRLRPELLALMVLLLAIAAAAHRRYAALAALAFAFTLGYTAFHVFAALCLFWFLWSRYRHRRWDPTLLAASFGGIAAGLVLRPHPVANLQLWYTQNVLFFLNMQRLDVGNEISPPVFPRTLWVSAMWIAGVAVIIGLALRSRSLERRNLVEDDLLPYTAIAAVLFIVLFFRFGRMALYAFPLTTLTVMMVFGDRVRPRAVATILAVSTLLAVPIAFDRDKRTFIEAGSTDVSELDWWALGRVMPRDAKVAARWSDAEVYAFWAPQGRYLNVLDPIFMAVPFPRQYAAQRKLFDGSDPDVPRTVVRVLDSDYLALDWTFVGDDLVQRLRGDPRLETVYGGYNALFRVRRPQKVRFITDWSPLPRDSDPLAGFVDATSVARGHCAALMHLETLAEPGLRRYEFAPWGPSTMAIDGTILASLTSARRAILGRGSRVEVMLQRGPHRFEVRTCSADGAAGFFLVDRTGTSFATIRAASRRTS